jgi:hypothetical protein
MRYDEALFLFCVLQRAFSDNNNGISAVGWFV